MNEINETEQQGNVLEIDTFIDVQEDEQVPLRWRELLGVLCLVVLCDVTIYRGEGFAGYALLFLVAPILLWLSSYQRCRGLAFWIVSTMLAALAGKLIWFGSGELVAIGFVLIVAFAMTIVGLTPYILEALFFTLRTVQAGYVGIIQYGRRFHTLSSIIPRAGWISIVLPLLAFLVFGWIFILANPNLVIWFGEGFQQAFEWFQNWVLRFSPDLLEVGFWLVVLWIVVGLLRPGITRAKPASASQQKRTKETTLTTDATLYPAFRNTLITLIALFAVYLVFEFKTLWFHVFEPGFHYSGYAHKGAGWLTAALALATFTLSLIFRGSVLKDQRTSTLRKLAWLWSIENILLAASVYNRLSIYIGFNGMTRLRIVGLFGISAVVIGFLLVVWKIVHNKGFLWLVRTQLWTLAIALYLLALMPMDTIVVGYNVNRILDGHLAPSVQMSVQQINSEGILKLLPLLECEDEVIREGARALLAEHHQKAESLATKRDKSGWTTYQIADDNALQEFRKNSKQWKQYTKPRSRQKPLSRFRDYVYQWY